tara:strand:- start:11 stop:1069 length:1059 start_codon:yes stop_codon:yes gene_type:complete
MKKTFPTNRQRTTIFQQILLHFAPFLLQKNNHNEKKSLEREDKETTDINDGGEQKSRGEEEEEETQSKIMSFTDRNPLSLSMPQHNLKQLTKQLERDWNDEEEKRRREDAMRNEKSTHHAEERGSRNSNNNFNNIRGGGGNGGALRIDNVLVEDRPKLAYLTIEDLKKKAKPWREFFSTDYLRKSYSVPRTKREAYARFDRNVYEYLGNYRRCSWIIALALLYKKPKAIAGGVIILKLYDVLQVLGQTVAIQDSHKTVIQFFLQVLIWVVSIVTRVFASLSMAVAVVFTILGLHAILRRLDAPKPTKRNGKRISGVVWETKSPREMNNANNRGGIGGIIGSLINRNKTQRRT